MLSTSAYHVLGSVLLFCWIFPIYSQNPTAMPTLLPTITFGYTGDVQQCVVPPGTVSTTVRLTGAAGGDVSSSVNGGKGGTIEATFSSQTIPPGTMLYVRVGGKGAYGVVPGGFNGGGASTYSNSGSGGGATDIRMDSASSGRLAVAGGGGGADGYCPNVGGNAGGLVGSPGGNILCNNYEFTAGGGGTQNGGGAAGISSEYGNGIAGALSLGATGGSGLGPGGGGGYYGGGSTSGGGAGGGSSFATASALSILHLTPVNV